MIQSSMNPSEANTYKYFSKTKHAISKVSETDTKTPDFEGENVLVEVKQITPNQVEGLSNDSTYNAIKNNLRDAARKFRAYDSSNAKRHIVVIYSDEIDRNDIYSVWTGEWSPEHKDRVFKGGMLLSSDHKQYIDGIAWFKKDTDQTPTYVWATTEDMRQYFPEISHE